MGLLFTDTLAESLYELFLSPSYLPGRLYTELGKWWANDHLSAVDLNTWEIYLWLLFPFSTSRAHPKSGWYHHLFRTFPLPIISTVMLCLPMFTRLSFPVLHHLLSAEWGFLFVYFVFPSMAYFSICMTFCNLGHCVHRFSILEGQKDERRVLFEESCKMKVCYKLFQEGAQEDANENVNQKC